MKKLLLIITILLCAAVGLAQSSPDTYNVTTFAELKSVIRENPSANIRLRANISLEDTEGDVTICSKFSGTISGLTYVENPKTGEFMETNYAIYGGIGGTSLKAQGALFVELDGATIDHVSFTNLILDKKDDSEDNWGIVCRTAKNTTFRNVAINRVSVLGNEDNVGSVVGQAEVCTFERVTVADSDVKSDGICAGGVVGKSNGCTFKTCVINPGTAVFADGTLPDAFAGGISGYSDHDTFRDNCLNMGLVGACNDAVGGITGFSKGSDFIQCTSSGKVLQCKESEFDEITSSTRAQMATLTLEELQQYNPGLITLGIGTGLAAGFGTFVGGVFAGAALGDILGSVGLVAAAILDTGGVILVVAAAVAVAIGIALIFDELTQDDEAGGICGRAEGGSFESCTNNSSIRCRDEYGGGIVGYGAGVTINNCLNTAYGRYTEKTCGSIIGYATDLNSNKTKVNNCLTVADYPIIGDDDDVDPNSFNNYRLRLAVSPDDRRPTISYEVEVSTPDLNSGVVARWLNNGMENRAAGVKPWHQDVWTVTTPQGKGWDSYPVLDATHLEVKPEYVAVDYEISTPEQLMEFASAVNSATEADKKQFLRAALVNDIDMKGYFWTPIGKKESYRQFRGFFDGRGHTIRNIYCKNDEQAVGLFGTLHVNAEICNVIVGYSAGFNAGDQILADCDIRTGSDLGAGGIAGRVDIDWSWGNVVIENCGSYADVTTQKHAGGILGRIFTNGTNNVRVYINNCFNIGNVIVSGGNSGLICGYTQNNAVVTNCWSVNKLTSINESKPYDDTRTEPEIFAGYYSKLDIRNCYCIVLPQYLSGDLHQAGVTNIDVTNSDDGMGNFQVDGHLTYLLNGSTNDPSKSLSWQQEFGVDPFPVFGNKGVYYSRNLSDKSNGFGTVCMPYDLKSDEEKSYYVFSESTEDGEAVTLTFEFVEILPAGTPALFVGTPGEISFYGAGDGWATAPVNPESGDWRFMGTYHSQAFEGADASDKYYISGGAIKHGSKVQIDPFRAYIIGQDYDELMGNSGNPQEARVLIAIDDENGQSTALKLVYDADAIRSARSNKSYTLYGTLAGEGHRGLVVRNGQVIMEK